MNLSGSSLLVTGATGSFGGAFVRRLLAMSQGPDRICILSRDEHKHNRMRQELHDDHRLRWFLGCVRDKERLTMAFRGVDYIVHAAAQKIVPAAEYDPRECILTNVIGGLNVAQAAFECGVKKVIALSTDKATNPTTTYGASKLCMERVFIAANAWAGPRYAVTRYGNVLDSVSSVSHVFRASLKAGRPLPITDPDMTRFMMTLGQAVDLVLLALERAKGGEVFVPKLPSYTVAGFAEAMAGRDYQWEAIGARPSEKMHESLVAPDEARYTRDYGDHYRILPSHPWFEQDGGGTPVPEGFEYSSRTANMTVEDLEAVLG